MTWVTLRAVSLSFELPPTKSGMAIGIGWMLPCVTSMLTTALAERGCKPKAAPVAAPAAAPASSARRVIPS